LHVDGYRQGNRWHRIMLSSVASMAVPYFSTISHKRHGFRKNLLNLKCVIVNILKNFSRNIFFLQIIQLDTIITVYRSSCNIPFTFVTF